LAREDNYRFYKREAKDFGWKIKLNYLWIELNVVQIK